MTFEDVTDCQFDDDQAADPCEVFDALVDENPDGALDAVRDALAGLVDDDAVAAERFGRRLLEVA